MTSRSKFTLLMMCSLLLTAHAVAQDLTLKVKGKNPRFRSQAPIPLEFVLNWNSDKLIEGTLIVEVKDSLTVLYRYENPDIAMSFGDFVLPVVLPPLMNETESIEITSKFVSAEWGPFQLDPATIKVPADWRRQLVIGLVTAEADEVVKSSFDYLKRIGLDQYRPKSGTGTKTAEIQELGVTSVRFTARNAPRRVAPLCAYDVIALAADSLQELKQSQFDALLDWADAGGSVFVDGSGSVSDNECRFLNELTNREKGENEFIAGTDDRLVGKTAITFARRGLGRIVVTTQSPNSFSNETAFEVTCWLWKVRQRTKTQIAKSGRWTAVESVTPSEPTELEISELVAQGYPLDGTSPIGTVAPPYAPKPLRPVINLKRSLLPESIETVPLPIIMAVLCLFLLAIAPGDWLLLGKLNKRMLTWILFPACCIFFTIVMVVLANRYVGVEDYRTALRLIDWTTESRVARITNIETAFTSTSAPVELKLDDQLFSYVETSGADQWRMVSGGQLNNTGFFRDSVPAEGELPTPKITGRPTTLYSVELPLRKWTPTVLRSSTFGVDPKEVPEVDWAGISPADVFNAPKAAADRLAKANPKAAVRILQSENTTRPTSPDPPETSLVSARTNSFAKIAVSASAIPTRGLLSVVSALSPNGHNTLEDVSILDRTNPDEAAVIVVVGDIGDVHVHRRMFYRETIDSDGTNLNETQP